MPEIDGTFIEVETMVEPDDVGPALDDLRTLLLDLEISPDAVTRELYTDAVARHRSGVS